MVKGGWEVCIAEFDYSVKIDAQKVLKNRLKYPPPQVAVYQ